MEYIQVHDNADDGIEFYGGDVNVKYAVITGARDDSVDWDEGYQGNMQYVIVKQSPEGSGEAFEMDTQGADEPLSKPTVSNVTIIANKQANDDSYIMQFKKKSGGFFHNVVATVDADSPNTFDTCARITGGSEANVGTSLVFNNWIQDCGNAPGDHGVLATVDMAGAAVNVNATFANLNSLGASTDSAAKLDAPLDWAAINTSFGESVADVDFLDATDYIGAVDPDATTAWWAGWTIEGSLGSAVDANPPVVEACGADSQIQFVKEVSESYYYWYDELAQVDAANYSDASAYLSAIMQPIWTDGTGRDPGFSYLTTIEEDTQRFTAGTFYGYGVRYRIINDDFYFADSYEDSPAYTAGIRRGQRLLAVKLDGQADFETWEELVARNAALPGAVFGPRGELQTTIFRVEYEGEESEISVTTAETTTPPLAGEALVIERDNDTPVGYINFRTFIDAADGPLRTAATTFRDAGVTDLIIDLRYNGGGLVRIAETFLNLLAGDNANGELSYIINLNDKQQNQNSTANFRSLPETFSPLRIAFITTGGSASASELLINGLDPHIELALVGSETSGKAVGQFAFDLADACPTRLRLIAFEIQNGEGQGGYFTGLVDTGRFTFFAAEDDATRPFADPEEDSFAVALGWLDGTISKSDQMTQSALPLIEDIGVAPFDASWPVDENAPLNPDGSVRSF